MGRKERLAMVERVRRVSQLDGSLIGQSMWESYAIGEKKNFFQSMCLSFKETLSPLPLPPGEL